MGWRYKWCVIIRNITITGTRNAHFFSWHLLLRYKAQKAGPFKDHFLGCKCHFLMSNYLWSIYMYHKYNQWSMNRKQSTYVDCTLQSGNQYKAWLLWHSLIYSTYTIQVWVGYIPTSWKYATVIMHLYFWFWSCEMSIDHCRHWHMA